MILSIIDIYNKQLSDNTKNMDIHKAMLPII